MSSYYASKYNATLKLIAASRLSFAEAVSILWKCWLHVGTDAPCGRWGNAHQQLQFSLFFKELCAIAVPGSEVWEQNAGLAAAMSGMLLFSSQKRTQRAPAVLIVNESCGQANVQSHNYINPCCIAIYVSPLTAVFALYCVSKMSMILLLPWKPHGWHLTHIKLSKRNQSAIKCRCILWKIIHNRPVLMKLCQPVLGVRFYETRYIFYTYIF